MTQKFYLSLTVLLLLGIILFSCSKENELVVENSIQNKIVLENGIIKENILVTEYRNSSDFKNNNLLKNTDFDFSKSEIIYIDNNINLPILKIPTFLNGNLVGVLDVIKNKNSKIFLPNNNEYFVMYRDFSKFNFKNNSGQIIFKDLNYDNLTFNNITYNKGVYLKNYFTKTPISTLEKYNDVLYKNKLFLKTIKNNQLAKRLPCDGNGNGNLSFSECYSCFNSSCASSPDCYTLCYGIGDVLGWVSPAPGLPMCQGSIAASCIYLAAVY